MADAFRPFVTQIVNFFKELAQGGTETQETIGKIAAFAMAIKKLGGLLFGAILAIDEFGVSMKGLFNTIAGGAQVMWNGFEILLTGIKGMILMVEGLFVELLDKLTFGTLPGLESDEGEDHRMGVDHQRILRQERRGGGGRPRPSQPGTLAARRRHGERPAKSVGPFGRKLKALPATETVESSIDGRRQGLLGDRLYQEGHRSGSRKKEVTIDVDADQTKITRAGNAIMEQFPDGSARIVTIGPSIDDKARRRPRKTRSLPWPATRT